MPSQTTSGDSLHVSITQPGSWIDADRAETRGVQRLIDELLSQLVDASIGLGMFEQARVEQP
jgi:hypothetical protein